ncbi:MAG: cytochrome c [Acidobacteria bacterium]|nr:cytochrome c [Acidobacteriota bacterium]
MPRAKLFAVAMFAAIGLAGCFGGGGGRHVIGESKAYEASLFRQNCAICHGPEGDGKILDDGMKVPSLREGDFKAKTENQIYDQIANGGNGMVGFRRQLSEREMRLLVDLVKRDLRGQ